MTIPVTYSVTATQPVVGNDVSNVDTGKLATMLGSVKNSPENISTSASLTSSISASAGKLFVALGFDKLVQGLTWVGNRAGNMAQITQFTAEAAQRLHDGAKIVKYGMEHGIKGLLYEVLVLLKDQAPPILESWIGKVYEAGENVTLGEVMKSLMDCIINNKEISGLFKGIIAA